MKTCDNTSVGMIIKNSKDEILLIERKKPPFGFAPPTGHVDDHGSFDKAVIGETWEEVGLKVASLKPLIEGRMENMCRRLNGTWHYWKIYEIKTSGKIKRSLNETKKAGWYGMKDLKRLKTRTEDYMSELITEDSWEAKPGLEPVWVSWFGKLKIF